MKKDALLKSIAETGYNVGYGAKKHFATFDMVEKLPGWVSLFSIAVTVFSLFVPYLEQKWITASLLIISIGAAAIVIYDKDKAKYAECGTQLTASFHELRLLYQSIADQADGTDLSAFENEHKRIQDEALKIGISKQLFLSDWIAHYKFFWQSQTGWMDEQLHFRLVRDKLPLGLIVTLIAGVACAIYYAISSRLIEAICQGPL